MQLSLWTPAEDITIKRMKSDGATDKKIAETIGRTEQAVRGRRRRIHSVTETQMRIAESPFPRYDSPLVMEGDALVLPDVEIPYADHEFLNNCIELARKWKIDQCILAGDFLHFDSLTHWEPCWTNDSEDGIHLNLSQELEMARRDTKVLSQAFKKIDFVLGNHSGRLLRALSSPIFPSEILRLIEAGNRWRIAPYYYSILISNGEKYQIEHPNSATKVSPIKLASKYQCHILQAHSHKWGIDRDISGRFWAISMGCVVDEMRLPYAAQRHNTGEAHVLGAVIVKDGYPYVLSDKTPWSRYMRL